MTKGNLPGETEAQSAERTLANTYDRTPYAGQPFCFTHPGLLAAFGSLYGLSPVPPDHCRVLEMGCGDGGNIIPMAYQFPASKFIGIDLSPVQIGIGQAQVDSLGLANIRLQARSIMDIDAADGMFDYIIVHGVYSWVPDRVKAKILDVCRNRLPPHGIAYISYNVLPGWQFNKSMRDMMLYRTRGIEDPEKRTNAALDMVKIMLECTTDSQQVHDVQRRFFGKTLQGFEDASSYLLHEYLEADNDPFYFHEFAGALEKNGLQYVCDAEQAEFELDSLPVDSAGKFEEISENTLDVEQYIDFLKNTRFRRSLICHAGVNLDSDYHFERLTHLFAATTVIPVLNTPQETLADATAFRTTTGRRLSTKHSLALVILRKLCEIRPCTMDLPSLIQAVQREQSPEPGQDGNHRDEKIGHVVYSLFFNGVVELLAAARSCTLEIGDRPTASSIARLMAPSRRITNLCHRTVVIDDDMACFVLSHLDGTRDRDVLAELMLQEVRSGRVNLPKHKNNNVEATHELIVRQLESILQNFSRCGFLARR
jgi:methyltransferase-like protein/trans-aconitate methyltransferase